MPPYLTIKQKAALVLVLTMSMKKRQKKYRLWTKRHMLEAEQLNHMILLREIDDSDYRSCLRIDDKSFDRLLHLVRPLITKQDTVMRRAVSAEDRLAVTLKYLALGKDYSELAYSSGISVPSISKIIPETCEAISKVLKKYLQLPETENEWLTLADQYRQIWHFDHCLGSMGARHILVVRPKEKGSLYYNYQGTFSVVLFAVVNANYEFLFAHVGVKGSLSDGHILEHTQFYDKLIDDELNLPQASLLPGTNLLAPYVFIGDHGFGMDKYILEPYPQHGITHKRSIFNYRHARAKRTTDNAFGILASRFAVLRRHILVDIQNVEKIVMASCILHNYLRRTSVNYITHDYVDYEDIENGTLQQGQWREHNALLHLQKIERLHTADNPNVKQIFKKYFNESDATRLTYLYR